MGRFGSARLPPASSLLIALLSLTLKSFSFVLTAERTPSYTLPFFSCTLTTTPRSAWHAYSILSRLEKDGASWAPLPGPPSFAALPLPPEARSFFLNSDHCLTDAPPGPRAPPPPPPPLTEAILSHRRRSLRTRPRGTVERARCGCLTRGVRARCRGSPDRASRGPRATLLPPIAALSVSRALASRSRARPPPGAPARRRSPPRPGLPLACAYTTSTTASSCRLPPRAAFVCRVRVRVRARRSSSPASLLRASEDVVDVGGLDLREVDGGHRSFGADEAPRDGVGGGDGVMVTSLVSRRHARIRGIARVIRGIVGWMMR